MFRSIFSTLCLIFIVRASGRLNVERNKNYSPLQMVEVSAALDGDTSFLEGDNESQVNDISTAPNVSFVGLVNEIEAAGQQSVRLGQWAILRCTNNEYSWMCDLERHLLIPETGLRDTLRFTVGDEKLKIGCDCKQSATIGTTKSATINRSSLIHIRFVLECPSHRDFDVCSLSGLYFPTFWLGMMVGIIVGIMFIALFSSCVSASASRIDDKTRIKS